MGVPALSLLPEEVHVWLAFPDQITDEPSLTRCRSVLTPEEQAATGRFVFPRHRHQHLLTRALQRDLLSRYTGEQPAAWRFEKNRYGRPEISSPRLRHRLRFNLSHTDGLIACAVTPERDVGVDVEYVGRPTRVMELAPSVFAPPELTSLQRLHPGEQRARFFALWTLKEAYIKARGKGLSIPLDKFSFTLEHDTEIGIDIDPSLEDDAATWHFERTYATGEHALALAARRTDGRPLRVSYFQTIPLRTDLRIELDLRHAARLGLVGLV
jgi:4'-phosphopantetheinyl transferase